MNPLNLGAWCAALFLAANLFPHTVALRLTLLVLGLAFVGLALARAKRLVELKVLPPLLVPILLWAAWAALSITWSVEPDRSLKEFKNEVVYVFLGYWLCWVAAQAPGARRAFGTVVGAGAVLACLIGLYTYAVPAVPSWLARLASGPGDQSSALLTLMPLSLAAIWIARVEHRSRHIELALLSLPLLLLAAGYATLNRTLWIGFAGEFLTMVVFALPRPEFAAARGVMRNKFVAGLLVAAFSAAVASILVHVQVERVEQNANVVVANEPRPQVWAYALDTIAERPITGLGFGRGIDRREMRAQFKDPQFWHPHNLILATAVQAGLPGAALLILLVLLTGFQGWRLAHSIDAGKAAYGAAIVAVVAGMIVRNTTDALLARQNALLFWGIVGALLALATFRSDSKTRT